MVWRLSEAGLKIVKAAQKAKGISQVKWAEAVENNSSNKETCSESSLKRFLNPKVGVLPDLFKAICKVIDVAPDKVRDKSDEPPPESGGNSPQPEAPQPNAPSGIMNIGSMTARDNAQVAQQINNTYNNTYNLPFVNDPPAQQEGVLSSYVRRKEEEDSVIEALQSEDESQGFVVCAIQGLGGIGKTTLAAAVVDQIKDSFPDGILWAELGKEPDILRILSGWIKALGDYAYTPDNIDSAQGKVRSLLQNKKVLIVLDNLWRTMDFEYLRLGNNRCRMLVTTRQAQICASARRIQLGEMTLQQSLELLNNIAGEKISNEDNQIIIEFAAEAGYLPLALELGARRIVVDEIPWSELLVDLRSEIARLENLDADIDDDSKKNSSVYKRYSLQASLNLSLQGLNENQKKNSLF